MGKQSIVPIYIYPIYNKGQWHTVINTGLLIPIVNGAQGLCSPLHLHEMIPLITAPCLTFGSFILRKYPKNFNTLTVHQQKMVWFKRLNFAPRIPCILDWSTFFFAAAVFAHLHKCAFVATGNSLNGTGRMRERHDELLSGHRIRQRRCSQGKDHSGRIKTQQSFWFGRLTWINVTALKCKIPLLSWQSQFNNRKTQLPPSVSVPLIPSNLIFLGQLGFNKSQFF